MAYTENGLMMQQTRTYDKPALNQAEMSPSNVQERISHTLANLARAMELLDIIEGDGDKPSNASTPMYGLIGGAIAVEEVSSALIARLSSIRDRLGSL